jgi:AcrR family transcriptional regulator
VTATDGTGDGDPARTPRVAEIVAAARRVLERDGLAGLTMQSVASELRIKAPSLYKHLGGKDAIRVELIVDALVEMGAALHASLADKEGDHDGHGDRDGHDAIAALLATYRRYALAHPELYRLATTGRLPRDRLPSGLEDWAGEPFSRVTGDPHRSQALWSFAHGMVVLELDDRYPDGSDLDVTWAAGAAAFASRATGDRSGLT